MVSLQHGYTLPVSTHTILKVSHVCVLTHQQKPYNFLQEKLVIWFGLRVPIPAQLPARPLFYVFDSLSYMIH